MRPVSNHAAGRASLTCTPASLEQLVVEVDDPRGSPKPLGLDSSGTTSGCGTCRPSSCRGPAIVLVPLRPGPGDEEDLARVVGRLGITR